MHTRMYHFIFLIAVQVFFLLGCEKSPAQDADSAGKVNISDHRQAGVDGEDWPVFLGTQKYGLSKETGLLDSWPKAGPRLVWERELGTGYSAPSIRGNLLVIHHRINDQEIVECLDAQTAKKLWKYETVSSFKDPYGYNNGPRCSPLLTKNRCYTFGAQGRLLCLELQTGKLIWERDTQKEFKIPRAFFGVGATPILEGHRLIVLVGGQPNSGVVAFDAGTGKILWENIGQKTWEGVETGWPAPKQYQWSGEEMLVSYSSPVAVTIHGKRHVLCLMRQGLVSVDPETGQENFKYWFRARLHDSVNAARPVVLGDTILLSAAYRTGAALLKVSEDGKSITEVWRDRRSFMTHWSTPTPVGEYVFGFSGRHENEAALKCMNVATGEIAWQTSGWEGSMDHFKPASSSTVTNSKTGKIEAWPYYGRGSSIFADGKLIVFGERGTLALVEADTKSFQEISRFKPVRMEYPCWAAPVLSRGKIYLRCDHALVCYDLKSPTEK